MAHRRDADRATGNRALQRAIGRPQRVLDVGCHGGENSLVARHRGAYVIGIETHADERARAKASLHEALDIRIDDSASVVDGLGNRRFDLMLLEASLLKAKNPDAALARLLGFLDDEGHVLYALPNAASGSASSIMPLFEEAGLELLRIDERLTLVSPASGWIARERVLVARKRPRPRKLTLTVGMLTMDEEESVAKMIGEIRAIAPDARILCVDSTTRDKTPEIAARLGARVLRQWPPRGHGPAMELLMYTAAQESEALIYLDCDFTYPIKSIPTLRRLLEVEAVDMVNGARTRHKPEAMPYPNFIANRTFAAAAHALHGVPTTDVHSGMRAYRSSVIRAFDFDGEGDALPIDTLLWPAKCGYRVVEMAIDYDERVGASKLRKLAGTAWTFVRLARTLPIGTRGGRAFELR